MIFSILVAVGQQVWTAGDGVVQMSHLQSERERASGIVAEIDEHRSHTCPGDYRHLIVSTCTSVRYRLGPTDYTTHIPVRLIRYPLGLQTWG